MHRLLAAVAVAATLAAAPEARAAGWLPVETLGPPGNPNDLVALSARGDMVVPTLLADKVVAYTRPAGGGAWTGADLPVTGGKPAGQAWPLADSRGRLVVLFTDTAEDGSSRGALNVFVREPGAAFVRAPGFNLVDASYLDHASLSESGLLAVVQNNQGTSIDVYGGPATGSLVATPIVPAPGRSFDDPQLQPSGDGAMLVHVDEDQTTAQLRARRVGADGKLSDSQLLYEATPHFDQKNANLGILDIAPVPGTADADVLFYRGIKGADDVTTYELRVARVRGSDLQLAGPPLVVATAASGFAVVFYQGAIATAEDGSTTVAWADYTANTLRTSTRPAFEGTFSGPADLRAGGSLVGLEPLRGGGALALVADGSAGLAFVRPKGTDRFGAASEFAQGSAMSAAAGGGSVALRLNQQPDGASEVVRATAFDATPPSLGLTGPAAATAGDRVAFAATVADNLSSVAPPAWDFGDGTTAGAGLAAEHAFARAGQFLVRAGTADGAGNAASATATIDVAAARDTKAPVLSKARLSRRTFAVAGGRKSKRGARVSWTLDEDAAIKVTVKSTKKGRRRPKGGTLTRAAKAGAGALRFSGRFGKRRLKPGRYTMRLTPTDAAGNRGKAVVLRFRIVRRR